MKKTFVTLCVLAVLALGGCCGKEDPDIALVQQSAFKLNASGELSPGEIYYPAATDKTFALKVKKSYAELLESSKDLGALSQGLFPVSDMSEDQMIVANAAVLLVKKGMIKSTEVVEAASKSKAFRGLVKERLNKHYRLSNATSVSAPTPVPPTPAPVAPTATAPAPAPIVTPTTATVTAAPGV